MNNGLDLKNLIDIDIKNRNSKNILLLYHEIEWKGF